MDPSVTNKPAQNPDGWGPLIGIIIIVALLLAGGIYFWMSSQQVPIPAPAIGAGRA